MSIDSKDILIIEDDKAIVRILQLELTYEGYTFDIAIDGRKGLELFEKNTYKIILLDLMLPYISGLEVCQRIRKESNVHIIMMTAKRDVNDRIVGLDSGADDYITKPFEMQELLARLRAILRRVKMDSTDYSKIEVGDLSINTLTREVIKRGQSIELTKKEFELLEYMAKNSGIVLTRNQIIDEIWGCDFYGDTNNLDVYIKFLRDKIDYPFETKHIHTVRGVGYTLKA